MQEAGAAYARWAKTGHCATPSPTPPALLLAVLRGQHLEAMRAVARQLRHLAELPVQLRRHLLALAVRAFIRPAIPAPSTSTQRPLPEPGRGSTGAAGGAVTPTAPRPRVVMAAWAAA
ncbi:hypothetical protein [Janthinobacterium sp.]|uniref:hypothetical protein n=1 Tax=Janthinobacterium sp. TaxID=1871054 RepID=UPI00289CC9E4|nr:hypothetical protein [Janthinobacterium sp.]